jgi:hypothetical protein
MIRISASIFAFSVAVNSAALSALGVLILASVAKRSETLVGVGFLWFLSLPTVVVLAAFTALLFPEYASRETLKAQLALYVPVIVAIALTAPILTYQGLPLIALYLGR